MASGWFTGKQGASAQITGWVLAVTKTADTMRLILWVIVAVLVVLAFAGENVRRYFSRDEADVAIQPDKATSDAYSKRGSVPASADKPEAEKPSSGRSYVPSPADAPELYDSPTRRLGF